MRRGKRGFVLIGRPVYAGTLQCRRYIELTRAAMVVSERLAAVLLRRRALLEQEEARA